jgi:hypothetical protein
MQRKGKQKNRWAFGKYRAHPVTRRQTAGMLHRWGMWLPLVLAIAAVPASAKNGRDFAGYYDLTQVTDLGDAFQVTFSLRLFNFGDSDVDGATLTLADPLRRKQSYGAFQAVSVRQRERVRLNDLIVTVPRREYERWRQGGPPALQIEFTAADGQTVRRRVELSRQPLGQGGQ